jgi:hypothetical protein
MSENGENRGDILSERLLDYIVQIIKLVNYLPKTIVGEHIGGQILVFSHIKWVVLSSPLKRGVKGCVYNEKNTI